jgi:hypothetical protein
VALDLCPCVWISHHHQSPITSFAYGFCSAARRDCIAIHVSTVCLASRVSSEPVNDLIGLAMLIDCCSHAAIALATALSQSSNQMLSGVVTGFATTKRL